MQCMKTGVQRGGELNEAYFDKQDTVAGAVSVPILLLSQLAILSKNQKQNRNSPLPCGENNKR